MASHVLSSPRGSFWCPRPPIASPELQVSPDPVERQIFAFPVEGGSGALAPRAEQVGWPRMDPGPVWQPTAHVGAVPRLQLESVALTGKNPCCENSQPADIPARRQSGKSSRRKEGAMSPAGPHPPPQRPAARTPRTLLPGPLGCTLYDPRKTPNLLLIQAQCLSKNTNAGPGGRPSCNLLLDA